MSEAVHQELSASELRLKGYTKVEDLHHSYGIELPAEGSMSLDELLRQSFTGEPEKDQSKDFGEVRLFVREMVGQRIATVGIAPKVQQG